jgi:uncharacterized protein YecE (DUF72 family)
MPAKQLSLFGAPSPDFSAERALAARLPRHVRLGTSSWTFPGWSGIVYPPGTGEAELRERGLELYARHPLFGTVGIDRSYYAPLGADTLARYREQLPDGFRCVMKVWSEITSKVNPRTRAPNPHFFDVELLERKVLEPIRRSFSDRIGPLVLELMPLRPSELGPPAELGERLGRFLEALPREFSWAVELRNRELLTPEHLRMLTALGVGHVLNFWERMPDIGEQLALPGVLTAEVVVARLLLPPGRRYDDRERNFQPFDRLQDVQEKMRTDLVRLSEACEALGKVLLVIVNNKAEGSSPLTIRALAERLARPG